MAADARKSTDQEDSRTHKEKLRDIVESTMKLRTPEQILNDEETDRRRADARIENVKRLKQALWASYKPRPVRGKVKT